MTTPAIEGAPLGTVANPSPEQVAKATQAAADSVQAFEQQQPALAHSLYQKYRVEILAELAATRPTTYANALQAVRSAVAQYADTLRDKQYALAAWATLDQLGGSVRVRCADDLRAQGLNQTAADKQASDHPVYMKHKAELSAAMLARTEAEDKAALALQVLEVAKLQLEGFMLVQVEG